MNEKQIILTFKKLRFETQLYIKPNKKLKLFNLSFGITFWKNI